MARSLKTTISGTLAASDVALLVCVDDDNATIKDFSSANAAITNNGVTVHATKTWKSVTVPTIVFSASTDWLRIGSGTPQILSPCTYFCIVKDSNAAQDQVIFSSASSSGGTPDSSVVPLGTHGSNPSPIIRDQVNGNISLPGATLTLANGDDWSAFWTSDVAPAAANQTWFSLEGNTVGSDGNTAPNRQFDASGRTVAGSYVRQLGSNGSPTWVGDLIMFGALSKIIAQADAAAIHADPFGYLFDTAGAAAVPLAKSFGGLAHIAGSRKGVW